MRSQIINFVCVMQKGFLIEEKMCDCINGVNKSLNHFHSLTLECNYGKQMAAEQEIVCVSTLYENSGRSDC